MFYCLFHWFVKITGYIPQRMVFRLKVHYEDQAVQGRHIRSKAIVVSNHSNVWDVGVMMFVFWTRTLRCLAAELLYTKNFFMTSFLNLMGCIRVDRDHYDFSFIEKAKRILDRGGIVEIYPESRLPRPEEERPLEFKTSYLHLALESGAPIIPVYSNGQIFAKAPLRVIIGKPIDVMALYDASLSEKENIQNINAYVRSKIIALGEELQQQCREEKTPAV